MRITKEQLKKQHKDDKNRFNKIKGVAVISARHLKPFFQHKKFAGLYIQKKTYDWRITNKTHNLRFAKPGYVAKVIDAQGKRENRVLVTDIKDITGSVAMKMAKKIEPVIIFKDQTFINNKIIKK